MQQQVQRPIRRGEGQGTRDDNQELRPLSAREFMKLPASPILSARRRLAFSHLESPSIRGGSIHSRAL